MKAIVERHNLSVGDVFVVVGGSRSWERINSYDIQAGRVFCVKSISDDCNVKFEFGDTSVNINTQGDSRNPRIRLPYKNEVRLCEGFAKGVYLEQQRTLQGWDNESIKRFI